MVYITGRSSGVDLNKPRGSAQIVEYRADDASDLNSPDLPKPGTGFEGSTCFIINTSEVYMLGSTGWRKI